MKQSSQCNIWQRGPNIPAFPRYWNMYEDCSYPSWEDHIVGEGTVPNMSESVAYGFFLL